MFRNWFSSILARPSLAKRRADQFRRPLSLELLEDRTVPSTLWVDMNDPTANDPGDNLYAQIHEAVAVAAPGDHINVRSGAYEPFMVATDNLTIREANVNSNPVIDATGSAAGIQIDANGVTLRGLIVQNADREGFLVTGDSNTLAHNTARNNGLAVDPFADSSLVGGFTLIDADNNQLTGNVAENNALNGFLLRLDSDGNTLSGNSASSNGTSLSPTLKIGNGFSVTAGPDIFTATPDETSDNTTFINNTATGNATGFSVSGALKVTLVPEFMLEFFPAAGTSFINNTSSGNSSTGFVSSNTDGTRIIGNNSSDNRIDGFQVSSSTNAAVTGNLSQNNGFDGFWLPSLDNSTITGNKSMTNGRMFPGSGFVLPGSDGNTLTGNTASGNPFGGFDLRASNGNTLTGNIAKDNGEDGFILLGSSNNTLQGNRAVNNERDGFRLESQGQVTFNRVNTDPLLFEAELLGVLGSNNNTLQGNTASDNGGAGFHLIGASGNTLTNNTAIGNSGDGFRVERLDVFALVHPLVVNSGELLGSFDSDNNVFGSNTANNNDGWGFYVEALLSNVFDNNKANGNVLGDFNF